MLDSLPNKVDLESKHQQNLLLLPSVQFGENAGGNEGAENGQQNSQQQIFNFAHQMLGGIENELNNQPPPFPPYGGHPLLPPPQFLTNSMGSTTALIPPNGEHLEHPPLAFGQSILLGNSVEESTAMALGTAAAYFAAPLNPFESTMENGAAIANSATPNCFTAANSTSNLAILSLVSSGENREIPATINEDNEGTKRRTTTNNGHGIGMVAICRGCGLEIHDSHLLSLSRRRKPLKETQENGRQSVGPTQNGNEGEEEDGNEFWHEQCLRCAECGRQLGTEIGDGIGGGRSCFLRAGQPYCREDHAKLFNAGSNTGGLHRPPQCCSRCLLPIGPQEFVFRSAQWHVFHLHCFQCSCCGQQLAKGDQYLCSAEGGQLICQRDFGIWQLQHLAAAGVGKERGIIGREHLMPNDQPLHFLSIPPFPELDFTLQRPNFHHQHHHHHHSDRLKKVPKRPRTILNAPQRKAFKLAFEKGPKPSRKVREQLARETGLSVRVVQVWFQNQRAKMKKERKREMDKHQQQIGINGCAPMSTGGYTDSDGGGGERDEMEMDHQHFGPLKSPQSGSTTDDSEDIDGDEEAEEEESAEGSCNSSAVRFNMVASLARNCNGNVGMEGDQPRNGGQLQAQGMLQPLTTQQPNPIEKLYTMHQNYFSFV